MDIRVWTVDPLANEVDISMLRNEERRRAEFLPEERRAVYVAARVAFWQLLGGALGTSPRSIKIDTRCSFCGDPAHGKPVIANATKLINFSVSYSARLALITIGAPARVGIDVQEKVVDYRSHRLYFSESERRYLEQLEDSGRDMALTWAWARKEALAKADGRGFVFPLANIVVTGPPSGWKLPSCRWQLRDLDVGFELGAAVACEAPFVDVQISPWTAAATTRIEGDYVEPN